MGAGWGRVGAIGPLGQLSLCPDMQTAVCVEIDVSRRAATVAWKYKPGWSGENFGWGSI